MCVCVCVSSVQSVHVNAHCTEEKKSRTVIKARCNRHLLLCIHMTSHTHVLLQHTEEKEDEQAAIEARRNRIAALKAKHAQQASVANPTAAALQVCVCFVCVCVSVCACVCMCVCTQSQKCTHTGTAHLNQHLTHTHVARTYVSAHRNKQPQHTLPQRSYFDICTHTHGLLIDVSAHRSKQPQQAQNTQPQVVQLH